MRRRWQHRRSGRVAAVGRHAADSRGAEQEGPVSSATICLLRSPRQADPRGLLRDTTFAGPLGSIGCEAGGIDLRGHRRSKSLDVQTIFLGPSFRLPAQLLPAGNNLERLASQCPPKPDRRAAAWIYKALPKFRPRKVAFCSAEQNWHPIPCSANWPPFAPARPREPAEQARDCCGALLARQQPGRRG